MTACAADLVDQHGSSTPGLRPTWRRRGPTPPQLQARGRNTYPRRYVATELCVELHVLTATPAAGTLPAATSTAPSGVCVRGPGRDHDPPDRLEVAGDPLQPSQPSDESSAAKPLCTPPLLQRVGGPDGRPLGNWPSQRLPGNYLEASTRSRFSSTSLVRLNANRRGGRLSPA